MPSKSSYPFIPTESTPNTGELSGLGKIDSKQLSTNKNLWLVKAEPFLVLAAAPLLIFPRGPLPWLGLGLLLISMIARGLGCHKFFVRTPLDKPVVIILLMALISLYVSVDLSLSMPRFYAIVLGVFVFYATVGNVSSQRLFSLSLGLLIASIVAISLLGLIGTDWLVYKNPVLKTVFDRIPRLVRGIQTSMGPASGIQPNELGMILAFLLPLPMALLLRAPLSLLKKVTLSTVIVLGLGVLVLSASRSSLFGFATAAFGLLIWRWRRVGTASAVFAAAVLGLVLILDKDLILNILPQESAFNMGSVALTLADRQQLWDRALNMIEDFPFTGIGLNTFPVILGQLYPLISVSADALISHAHNIFLQTAIDLGMGGLLAFLGLWASLAWVGWRTCQQAGAPERNLNSFSGDSSLSLSLEPAVVGLLTGMIAYLVAGLTDNVSLGAKPMFLMWLMMGLIVASQRLVNNTKDKEADGTTKPGALGRLLGALRDTYWIVVYIFVALGYMVVGFAITGWTP